MENTKLYSGLFIIVPDKEETVDEVQNSISAVISDNSGNVSETKLVGKKKLAYPINKQSEGIFVEVEFAAPPLAISKMMRQFQINTDLLRAIIDKKQ